MGFLGKLLDKRKKSKFNKEAMRSAQRLLEDKLSARGRVRIPSAHFSEVLALYIDSLLASLCRCKFRLADRPFVLDRRTMIDMLLPSCCIVQ